MQLTLQEIAEMSLLDSSDTWVRLFSSRHIYTYTVALTQSSLPTSFRRPPQLNAKACGGIGE